MVGLRWPLGCNQSVGGDSSSGMSARSVETILCCTDLDASEKPNRW